MAGSPADDRGSPADVGDGRDEPPRPLTGRELAGMWGAKRPRGRGGRERPPARADEDAPPAPDA